MNYPTYKGPNRFTFKEVQKLFYIKHPEGFITKKINNNLYKDMRYSIKVSYSNGGKAYNYSVTSYVELVRRLNLDNRVIEADKTLSDEMVKYNAYTKTKEYIDDCNKNEFGIIF